MGRKLLRRRRRRLPAIVPVFMIAGLMVFIMALIGVVIGFSGLLDAVYMDLSMTLPKFDYIITETGGEDGNETFKVYQQMRYIGLGAMAVALMYAGVARVLETESLPLIQAGTSNKIIANSLFFVVIFLVFPPIWDASAYVIDDVALWVLNPLYSFDNERPCPVEWYDDLDRMVEEYNSSPFRKGDLAGDIIDNSDPDRTGRPTFGLQSETSRNEFSTERADAVCEPVFKVHYIFSQVIGSTDLTIVENDLIPESGDWMQDLGLNIQKAADEAFTNVFLSLTKSLITINVLITAFVIGVMVDVFLGMMIAALPFLMFLTLLPKIDRVVEPFISAIPALFILPLMSATIIVVGAGFVASIGVDCVTPESCAAIEEHNINVSDTLTYAWIASLAVVFLAITLPVMLVPILSSAVNMASRQITSGMQTGMMVTGMMASGAASGMMQGRGMIGAMGSGGGGMLSKLGIMASSIGGGAAHGMMRGGASASTEGVGDAGSLPGGKELGKMSKGFEGEFHDGGQPNPITNRLDKLFGYGPGSVGTATGGTGDGKSPGDGAMPGTDAGSDSGHSAPIKRPPGDPPDDDGGGGLLKPTEPQRGGGSGTGSGGGDGGGSGDGGGGQPNTGGQGDSQTKSSADAGGETQATVSEINSGVQDLNNKVDNQNSVLTDINNKLNS